MTRMFHRVLVASAVGAVALAATATALAADSGGGGGSGAETPTSVVVHLPQHVRAGQPVTVTARVTAQTPDRDQGAAPRPDTDRKGKAGSGGAGHGKGQGGGKGHGKAKGGSHRKGTGHGGGKARHQAVTGEVTFFLDGRAEPSAELDRGLASEKIEIPLGRHTLVAAYSGDADHEAARSTPVTFELTPGQTGSGGDQSEPGQDGGQTGSGPDGQDGPSRGGQDGFDGPDQGQYGPGQGGQDQGGQDQDGPDGGDSWARSFQTQTA